jgi:methylated-DNA-[protein]-cysteine S-methyltransferase
MPKIGKFQCFVSSPVGPIGIRVSRERVTRVEFLSWKPKPIASDDSFVLEVERQFKGYFSGGSSEFSIPINLHGTDFQKRVWRLMLMIKPGEVRTYGDIARELDSSPRAVGSACRSNPTPVIVPCHRVVSSNGIGGFAGTTSGRYLKIKRWLLEHEGVTL